jgi:hypothetical protein
MERLIASPIALDCGLVFSLSQIQAPLPAEKDEKRRYRVDYGLPFEPFALADF